MAGRGGGGWVWTDEQAQTNLPLQLLRSWWHNNALMYKLCPCQAQLMTILSFELQVWPWPSTYVKKCFKWHFSFLKTTTVQNYFKIHVNMYLLGPGQAQFVPNYFWNPCINVQVMAGQVQYMTILIFIWPLRSWPSTYLKKMFQMALFLLKCTNCAKWFWNPCIIEQVMLRKSSIQLYDHFDLYLPLWPWPSTYLKMFQMELILKDNNCAKLFWNPCIIVQVMVRINPHGRTHIHRTKIVTMSRLPASGLDKHGWLVV